MDDKKSDHGMDEKIADTIGNICTILGGALLLYPLIDKATKTLIPEMQKLTSGETAEKLKLMPAEHQKKPEHSESEKPDDRHYPEYGERNCD